jgi:hypothetical protein
VQRLYYFLNVSATNANVVDPTHPTTFRMPCAGVSSNGGPDGTEEFYVDSNSASNNCSNCCSGLLDFPAGTIQNPDILSPPPGGGPGGPPPPGEPDDCDYTPIPECNNPSLHCCDPDRCPRYGDAAYPLTCEIFGWCSDLGPTDYDKQACIYPDSIDCEAEADQTKYCARLSNMGVVGNEFNLCVDVLPEQGQGGGSEPTNDSRFTVYETGGFSTSDDPGVFVGTLYNKEGRWGTDVYKSPDGTLELNLVNATQSEDQNHPGPINSGFGRKAVILRAKTKARDFSDPIGHPEDPCQGNPDCVYAPFDLGSCDSAEELKIHDNYTFVAFSSPQMVAFEVTDTAICDCIKSEIENHDMEWNLNGNLYVEDVLGKRSGKISRGYRYSSWDESLPENAQIEAKAYKKYVENDEKPTFGFDADNVFVNNPEWDFDSDEKWAIEMYSGDLPNGPGSNVNQSIGKFQTKQRPGSWNDGSGESYKFAPTDNAPGGFSGLKNKSPEYLENFGYRQGRITEPQDFQDTKDLYDLFYKKPAPAQTNPVNSYIQGDPISGVGFCNAGVQEIRNTGVSAITILTTGNAIGGVRTPVNDDIVYGCFGSAYHLGGVQSGPANSMQYNLVFNIIEGECVSGSCSQIQPGGQAFLDCAVFGASTPFRDIGFFQQGETICPGQECSNPFAESTLPPGYGGGVQGFNPVIPRSRAYGDYVSSTYFKDNYDERSNFKPEQVFIGHYLARKIVDGECVTMLCPSKPGVDNYCRALPDCNL